MVINSTLDNVGPFGGLFIYPYLISISHRGQGHVS